MEVLCKSHYGNDHLQMGKIPITVAEDLGLSLNLCRHQFRNQRFNDSALNRSIWFVEYHATSGIYCIWSSLGFWNALLSSLISGCPKWFLMIWFLLIILQNNLMIQNNQTLKIWSTVIFYASNESWKVQ